MEQLLLLYFKKAIFAFPNKNDLEKLNSKTYMSISKSLFTKALAVMAMLAAPVAVQAAEVVYRIVDFNKSTADFILAPCGEIPANSSVYFENEYGATIGNRYNQIPNKRKAVLYLEGWQGCTIKSITLSLCSNNSTGQAGLILKDGATQLYKLNPADLASDTWFGQWVSKDLGVYVDLTKSLSVPALVAEEASITIQGGYSEGSVYLNAIAIEYDEAPGMTLESPLGWNYEKLVPKSTITEGDKVMIYRNGCAAGDIDGMETSHYMDAVAVASTSNVTGREVLCFTLGKGEDAGMWTLTDQYGRRLGATAKQSLAWDEGSMQWSIKLDYEGAIITNANAAYGTLRFNAPEGAYARFNTYTSKSLPLPYLYLCKGQNQPETVRSVTIAGDAEVTADVSKKFVALRASVSPSTATDRRIVWTSSDESVATVNGGYVTLVAEGKTVITATAHDGAAQASITLTVTDDSGSVKDIEADRGHGTYKIIENGRVIIVTPDNTRYGIDGVRR